MDALDGLPAPPSFELTVTVFVPVPACAPATVAETVHDRPSEYQTLVRVTVETEGLNRSVSGTLFAGLRFKWTHPSTTSVPR